MLAEKQRFVRGAVRVLYLQWSAAVVSPGRRHEYRRHEPVERQSGVRDRRQRRNRHGHHQEAVGLGPRRRGYRQADRSFVGKHPIPPIYWYNRMLYREGLTIIFCSAILHKHPCSTTWSNLFLLSIHLKAQHVYIQQRFFNCIIRFGWKIKENSFFIRFEESPISQGLFLRTFWPWLYLIS